MCVCFPAPPWGQCPKYKCMIGVVKVLQRGSAVIVRVNLKMKCKEIWLEEQRVEWGKEEGCGLVKLVLLRRGKGADSSKLHFSNFNHSFTIFMVFVKLLT